MNEPHVDIKKDVVNQSSREGARPKLLVLHTTESDNRAGLSDVEAIANWFDNSAAQASSHLVIDGEGKSARLVPDERKAWTVCYLNPVSLNIEQVGRASTTKAAWFKEHDAGLRKVAKWLAYWHFKYDIPLRLGATSGTRILRSGVVQHRHLGAAGCGHSDCGLEYPQRYVVRLAKLIVYNQTGQKRKAAYLRALINAQRKVYGLAPLPLDN